jgi:outer membrane protein
MEMMRMQRFTVLTAFQRAAALFLAASMVPAGWAQDASSVPSAPSAQMQAQQAVQSKAQPFDVKEYSQPRSAFPNLLAPYTARHVAPPNVANTPRIDQLLRDGKLYISMNDAVALALENNLDIAIARYNLNIADTDIWRAKAGSSILGVNSGVVQNTPGGGVGGLGTQVGSGQGGTSVAAGGAGTGTGGLVVSTLGNGPLITSFDPILTGTFQLDQNRTQVISPFAPPFSDSHTATWDFGYQQGFQWGTNLSVGFNNTRGTASPLSKFQPFSTQYNSNFRAQATQHLLQGFGFAPNTRFIQIAKNNREISDVAFRLQITSTVDQIENMYWDLVFAYENVRVQQEQLAFAQKTLSDTQKQVQIGTLAPIEVVRAQSTVATNQQTLTLALTNLQLQQLLMKNALSRTLVDPVLADAEVIPTSTMELPAQEPVIPTQDLVNDALGHRPELAEARINLSNTDISNKAIRSALRPTVDLFAYYGGQGLGGDQNPSNLCANQNPPIFGCSTKSAPSVGYSGTLNQLINSTAPDKGAGIAINIPLRNRAAQATQVRSEFEYRQAQLRIQQIENQIRIEVRNAQFGVQQNRASVASAQAALDLGRQSLDAEQKKYALGASTSTLVLQNEAAMTQAEVTLVSAKAAYEKAEVELDRAIGLLLDHSGIQIAEAERGEVTHAPTIPHVVERPADQPMPTNPPAPPPDQPQQ